jgi:UDPglucose--hexose-1-phosphate uridylyltransferase
VKVPEGNKVWEERWHPLREEWVIVAAHRQNRPWTGATSQTRMAELPEYAGDCYLCPGNERISGIKNPHYSSIYLFDNDHPCVSFDSPEELEKPSGIYLNRPAHGISRVVCYSPKHNLSLSQLDTDQVFDLLTVWKEQYIELGSLKEISHVLTFENRGEIVGVSNPHPHCQIYGTNFVFKTIENEVRASRNFYSETGKILFQEILRSEYEDGRRIICQNGGAVAFIPFFARYAYEVFVAPKAAHSSLISMSEDELRDLAAVLQQVTIKMDNLWRMPFPYVMVLHQPPTDGRDYSTFGFHIEFHPPLRKPDLQKFLAGPEIGGGNFLSDTSPEEKADELKIQSDTHYSC